MFFVLFVDPENYCSTSSGGTQIPVYENNGLVRNNEQCVGEYEIMRSVYCIHSNLFIKCIEIVLRIIG